MCVGVALGTRRVVAAVGASGQQREVCAAKTSTNTAIASQTLGASNRAKQNPSPPSLPLPPLHYLSGHHCCVVAVLSQDLLCHCHGGLDLCGVLFLEGSGFGGKVFLEVLVEGRCWWSGKPKGELVLCESEKYST